MKKNHQEERLDDDHVLAHGTVDFTGLFKEVKKTRQALHALGTAYYHISRLNLKTKKIELVKRSREMDMGIKENTSDWDPS